MLYVYCIHINDCIGVFGVVCCMLIYMLQCPAFAVCAFVCVYVATFICVYCCTYHTIANVLYIFTIFYIAYVVFTHPFSICLSCVAA